MERKGRAEKTLVMIVMVIAPTWMSGLHMWISVVVDSIHKVVYNRSIVV